MGKIIVDDVYKWRAFKTKKGVMNHFVIEMVGLLLMAREDKVNKF